MYVYLAPKNSRSKGGISSSLIEDERVGFFPIIIALNSSGLKKYSYIQSKWEEKKRTRGVH